MLAGLQSGVGGTLIPMYFGGSGQLDVEPFWLYRVFTGRICVFFFLLFFRPWLIWLYIYIYVYIYVSLSLISWLLDLNWLLRAV